MKGMTLDLFEARLEIGALPRRLDVTIDRFRAAFEAATEEQRAALTGTSQWSIVDTVLAVRAMERADGGHDLADAYDRTVEPGEDICASLLATFREAYAGTAPEPPHD